MAQHLAVIGLVVVAEEVEHSVNDCLIEFLALLLADEDVTQLPRSGCVGLGVDREGKDVGRTVDPPMLEVQLTHPRRIELHHREMGVRHPNAFEGRPHGRPQTGRHVLEPVTHSGFPGVGSSA